MRIITVTVLFIIGLIYFFQYDFDIKTCKIISIENDKLMVCPDRRFRAALGFYRNTNPKMIVLRSFDQETIRHETLHYLLFKFADRDLNNTDVQHDFIRQFELSINLIQKTIDNDKI